MPCALTITISLSCGTLSNALQIDMIYHFVVVRIIYQVIISKYVIIILLTILFVGLQTTDVICKGDWNANVTRLCTDYNYIIVSKISFNIAVTNYMLIVPDLVCYLRDLIYLHILKCLDCTLKHTHLLSIDYHTCEECLYIPRTLV